MELISAECLYQQFSAFLSGMRIEEDPMEKKGPSKEEVRQRAYELFLKRGGEHGSDVGDWLEAERELQERYARPQEIGEAAASR